MLEVIGETTVNVWYKEQEAELDLIIVKGRGPALFGRNWLNHLVFNWKEILHMSMDNRVEHLVKKYSKVFSNRLGYMSQHLAKLYLRPNIILKFWRHRPVPFALEDGIERERKRLQSLMIIKPVTSSEWACSPHCCCAKERRIHLYLW